LAKEPNLHNRFGTTEPSQRTPCYTLHRPFSKPKSCFKIPNMLHPLPHVIHRVPATEPNRRIQTHALLPPQVQSTHAHRHPSSPLQRLRRRGDAIIGALLSLVIAKRWAKCRAVGVEISEQRATLGTARRSLSRNLPTAGIVLPLERCNLVSVCQWRVSFVCQHRGF
jgi:hypothetical protein